MEELKAWWANNHDDAIYIIVVLVAAILITRITKAIINRYINASSGILKVDPTGFKFLRNSITVIIFLIAGVLIVYRLPGGKALAVSLFAGAGIFAAVAGFASQAAFSNIVGGIFIVIFRPFRVEDIIQVGSDRTGVVEDITLRHTVIRDYNNRRIIIPNASISEDTVTNFTIKDEKICRHVEIGISYGSDIKLARKIMQEEVMKHPLWIDNRNEETIAEGKPPVDVRVMSLGDSSVTMRAWAWANNQAEGFAMHTDLNESIKERFDAEGVEIPFPHRTLVFKDKGQSFPGAPQ